MAEVVCVDGSVLGVRPVPVLDRDGTAYEVTLQLLRDGAAFGDVGERCGWFLAGAASRLRAARRDDPTAFPMSSIEAGVRSYALDASDDPAAAWSVLSRYLPRDRELFCFRARDPDDLGTVGELAVRLEEERAWQPGPPGHWQVECRAVLEAWGGGGLGVRAVLTSSELQAFLDALVGECGQVAATYDVDAELPRR